MIVARLLAAALAQPGYEPTPAPLVANVLWYVQEDGLQKELKLTPEQVKQLVTARQKSWDFYFTTSPKEYGTRVAEQDKALEAAVKQALSPEQFARARQLAAQVAWGEYFGFDGGFPGGFGGFGGSGVFSVPAIRREGLDLTHVQGTTLFYSPELASALKLTDEQKKLATPGDFTPEGSVVYLTPDQTAAAVAFLGPIVKHNWKLAEDPRTVGLYDDGPYGSAPRLLGLTEARDVRAEVKMTDAQTKELDAVREKWTSTRREELSPEQSMRLRDELRAEEAVRRAHAEAVAKAVKADADFQTTDKAIKEATAARDKAVAAILTPDQAGKVAALRGPAFTGSRVPDRFGGPGGPGRFGGPGVALSTLRELTFGRYTPDLLAALIREAVQKELKLTPEQVTKLAAARQDISAKFPLTVESIRDEAEKAGKIFEERSKAIGKALTDILTAEQAKRFRQIVLQSRERPPAEGVRPRPSALVPSAVGYPGVADAVKLTPEQKKNLAGGTNPSEVLTADQKAAIKGMLGDPFKGPFAVTPSGDNPFSGGGGFDTPVGGLTPRTQLVMSLPWDAAKLTPDQVTRLVPVLTRYQVATQPQRGPAGGGGAGGGLRGPSPQKLSEAAAALNKEIDAILTPAQVKRLDQLVVQARAANDLRTALTGPEGPAAVKLTAEQTGRIGEFVRELSNVAGLVSQAGLPAEQDTELRQWLRDRLDERVADVLMADQKGAWRDRTGEPYAGFRKQPLTGGRFGRGGGGFGPGGP
jgi:hypothetical protein